MEKKCKDRGEKEIERKMDQLEETLVDKIRNISICMLF